MVTMMEVTGNVNIPPNEIRRVTLNGNSDMTAEISLTVIPPQSDDDDDDDDGMSSDCSSPDNENYTRNSANLMAAAMGDDVTAQLAAAGWQTLHLNGLCFCFAFFYFLFITI